MIGDLKYERGRVAYEAYRKFLSMSQPYDDLSDDTRQAWIAAADAAYDARFTVTPQGKLVGDIQ